MIRCVIEYDPRFYDPQPMDFCWLMESIIGLIFAEEMDGVDVRLRTFQDGDESTFPMFITIDGDEHVIGSVQDGLQSLADVVHAAIEDRCRQFPTGTQPLPEFRVWVRTQPGATSDPGTTER